MLIESKTSFCFGSSLRICESRLHFYFQESEVDSVSERYLLCEVWEKKDQIFSGFSGVERDIASK